jgi:hypothetical protein
MLGTFNITGPLAAGPIEHGFEAIAVFFVFGYQLVGFWGEKRLPGGGFMRACRVVAYSLYTLVFAMLAWPPALVWALFSVARADWLFHTPHAHARHPVTVVASIS